MLGQSYSSQSGWEGKTERGREMEKGREDGEGKGRERAGSEWEEEGGLGTGKGYGQREKGASIYAPRGPLSPTRLHFLIAHSAKISFSGN